MAEGAAKCAKLLLIVFNFIFWVSGAVVLGVGIWLRVDSNIVNYVEVVTIDLGNKVLAQVAYIFIAIGAFVFVVGLIGCCGAVKESRCLLGLYIVFMVTVMAGELAAGLLAAIYKDQVKNEIATHTVKTVHEDYDNGTQLGDNWDFCQYKLGCCGGKGPKDYDNSKYFNKTGRKNTKKVPKSCCKFKEDNKKTDMKKNKPKDEVKCQDDIDKNVTVSDYVNNKGCNDSLLTWFNEQSVILIGIGIGIACLEIFGFIFAAVLCASLGGKQV